MCKNTKESVNYPLQGSKGAMTLLVLFIWHFADSSSFGERFANMLEREFCGQEEKKGLENSSSLPILNNLEGA